jgi:hypothetical protein
MSGAVSTVFGIAGAFVGSFVGMPQLGYALGSAIGSTFEPTKKIDGPRITDLKVQSSQTGIIQPLCFGSELIAGNVIWASPKREVATTESQGKGGGGGTDVTNYSYFQDFAIGLADAENMTYVGIRTIRANGKVIYNIGADADADTRIESQKVAALLTFYSGSESQMPDPTIEAAIGVGKTPAHRGLCYVVFKNFDITPYGGQSPNLQFELVQAEDDDGDVFAVPNLLLTEPLWYCGEYAQGQAGPYPVFTSYEAMFTATAIAQVRAAAFEARPYLNRAINWTVGTGGYDGRAAIFTSADQQASVVYSAENWTGHDSIVMADSSPTRPAGTPAKHYKYVDYSVPSPSFVLIRLPRGSTQYRALRRAVANLGDYQESYQLGLGPCLRYDHPDFNNEAFWRAEAVKAGIPATSFGVDFGQFCDVVASNEFKIEEIQNAEGVSLGSIVTKICGRAGLQPAELDVSELTDKVHGFKIAGVATARDNLNPLMLAYFFDGYCDGDRVRFRKRGSAPVAMIPYGDLAARAGGDAEPSRLTITRVMEADMPQKMTVNFSDYLNGYEVGSEAASRATTMSRQQAVLEVPISMTHERAAKIADIAMRAAYVERHRFTFTCSRAYSHLEPTDVVDIENEAGDIYRVRITNKDDSTGLLAFQAVSENLSYDSNATGSPPVYANNGISSTGPTGMQVLDIPMLQDTDNDAGFYVALSSASTRWPGVLVMGSLDGMTYTTTGVAADQTAVTGTCDTTLGDWKGGPVFDKSSVLEVTLLSGELSSKSRDLILNGANKAVIGNEIVQFMTAELIGEKKYRLSNFIRGVRGTEQHIGTHVSGERFIYVGQTGFARIPSINSWIGTKRFYKAVTKGATLSSAEEIEFTNSAGGLKPLAPVRFGGGYPKAVAGDLVMSWQRRSRVDAAMRNNVGVPLGETTENYLIEIYKDSIIKRTIATTTNAATYTENMQIEDFGAPQSEIDIRVYQMSDVVGKGFAATHKYKRG